MPNQMTNEEKTEMVHNVFQNVSSKYDKLNDIISFNQHKAWRKYTMKQMKVTKGSKALDVCCGTGDWTIQMAEAVGPKGHVTGLDFSENMLEVAKSKVKNYDNINLIHGNAMEMPFEDNLFDYVTIGFGLRNLPDFEKGLAEIYRVLKPGGMLVILETSHPTMPVFKEGYTMYFKYVMPIFGKIFAKSMKEYSWLQQSAFDFPDKYALAKLMAGVGFTHIKFKGFTGGVSAMHKAIKPQK